MLSFILRTVSPQLLEKATLREHGGQRRADLRILTRKQPILRSSHCPAIQFSHPEHFRVETHPGQGRYVVRLTTQGIEPLTRRNTDSNRTQSEHPNIRPKPRRAEVGQVTSVTLLIPAPRHMTTLRKELSLLSEKEEPSLSHHIGLRNLKLSVAQSHKLIIAT